MIRIDSVTAVFDRQLHEVGIGEVDVDFFGFIAASHDSAVENLFVINGNDESDRSTGRLFVIDANQCMELDGRLAELDGAFADGVRTYSVLERLTTDFYGISIYRFISLGLSPILGETSKIKRF